MTMAQVALLEAPIAVGSPTRGQEYAYDALMARGLNSLFPQAALYPMEKPTIATSYPAHLKYLSTVMHVSRQLRVNVLDALSHGNYPVIVGGDHSIAMGSLAAFGEAEGAEDVALVYVDAHADINTEQTSASHYIHGMDLAAACGLCTDELTVGTQKVNLLGSNIHIVGGRSIDPPEFDIMERLGVHMHSAHEVRTRGIAAVLDDVLSAVAGKQLHISFDVDSIDPHDFTSTGYVLPEGLFVRDVEAIFDCLVPLSSSFECVEYNPTLDTTGRDGATLMGILAGVAAKIPQR